MATDAWGIDDGWWDDRRRGTTSRTRPASRSGPPWAPTATPRLPARGSWWPAPVRRPPLLGTGRACVLEDGTDAGTVDRAARPTCPSGIHDAHRPTTAPPRPRCSSGPGRCHLPDRPPHLGPHDAGARPPAPGRAGASATSPTCGRSPTWVAAEGGGALGLSPLHAPTPVAPIPPARTPRRAGAGATRCSSASTRCPGAAGDPVVAAAGRGRPPAPRRAPRRPRPVLGAPARRRSSTSGAPRPSAERAAARARGAPSRAPRSRAGPRFCALAEVHGPAWSAWPAELRHPDAPAVARAVAARWPTASRSTPGSSCSRGPAGAPAARARGPPRPGPRHRRRPRRRRRLAAPGPARPRTSDRRAARRLRAGRPAWGLPPFVPWRLRAAGLPPLAELLRAAMAGGGGLRVDHVMGLTRLFWIPEGRRPGGRRPTCASPATSCSTSSPSRAPGPARSWSARTSAPSRTSSATTLARRAACCRPASCGSRTSRPSACPPQSLGVRHHPRPARPSPACGPGADDAELAALGRPAPADAAAEVARPARPARRARPRSARRRTSWHVAHRGSAEGASALVLGTLEDLAACPTGPNVPGTTTDGAAELVHRPARRGRRSARRRPARPGDRGPWRNRGGQATRGD